MSGVQIVKRKRLALMDFPLTHSGFTSGDYKKGRSMTFPQRNFDLEFLCTKKFLNNALSDIFLRTKLIPLSHSCDSDQCQSPVERIQPK